MRCFESLLCVREMCHQAPRIAVFLHSISVGRGIWHHRWCGELAQPNGGSNARVNRQSQSCEGWWVCAQTYMHILNENYASHSMGLRTCEYHDTVYSRKAVCIEYVLDRRLVAEIVCFMFEKPCACLCDGRDTVFSFSFWQCTFCGRA